MTVYCFDIDGTICTNTDGDYEQAVPFKEVIEKMNHFIVWEITQLKRLNTTWALWRNFWTLLSDGK